MKPLAQLLQTAFQSASVRRSRDLVRHGVSRMQLQAAVANGLLQRAGRGLYMLPDSEEVTEKHTLAEVSQRIPKGAFCLLTALRFHELTTQNPPEVWVALAPSAWRPRLDTVKIRIVHFSGAALEEGMEQHQVEGIPVKVYNPAKTVADCFKFRHKLGLDVALEALREVWKARRATMEQLNHYAQVDRVSRVMRPYLETLT
jgi:predicted transcriptional regulator of viral defense system